MLATLQSAISQGQQGLSEFVGKLSALFDLPRASLLITVGEQVSTSRIVTLQVTDRIKRDARAGKFPNNVLSSNRFIVRVWASETAFGEPGGISTMDVLNGTKIEVVSGSHLLVVTDERGEAEIEVSAGAGDYFVMAAVSEEVEISGELEWV